MPELAIEQAMALGDATRVARISTTWTQAFYRRGRARTAQGWLDWIDERHLIDTHPHLAVTGALAHLIDGRGAAAERWLDAARRSASAHDTPTLRGHIALLRALACRDGLHTARDDADTAVALLPPADPYRSVALLTLGMACQLTHQPTRADTLLTEATDTAEDAGAAPTAAIARAERALLALHDGRTDDAHTLTARACAHIHNGGLDDYAISALVYAAAARVHLDHGDVATAKTALSHAQRLQAHLNLSMPFYTVQTRLEMARSYLGMTDVAGARTILRGAANVTRRRPNLGDLADQITQLQHQLDTLRTNMAGASSLTTAELRLLPLLATHRSFREIGQHLFISPNTVKTEAISIYRKLGASSRSQAIERARHLGLLPH
jgi:LuxR family maltose regulon positive regulatory protein